MHIIIKYTLSIPSVNASVSLCIRSNDTTAYQCLGSQAITPEYTIAILTNMDQATVVDR
jgi:hypothetical protein